MVFLRETTCSIEIKENFRYIYWVLFSSFNQLILCIGLFHKIYKELSNLPNQKNCTVSSYNFSVVHFCF